jgi:hypothetical protein
MPQFIAYTSPDAKPTATPLEPSPPRAPDDNAKHPVSIPADLMSLREQLEKDRQEWEAEAERQAESLAVQVRDVQEKQKQLQAERAEFEQQKSALVTPQSPDLEAVRQELLSLRDSLYQQYSRRRDAVVAMREAVRRAAYTIQEQKRELTQSQGRHESALEQHRHEQAGLDDRQNEVAQQAKLLEEWQRELNADQTELTGKKEALTLAQTDLETKTRELHADLVRLQRWQETLDGKQKDLNQREEVVLGRERHTRDEREKLTADQSELQQQETNLQARESSQVERGKDLAKHAAELVRQKEAVQNEAINVQDRTGRLAQWEQQLGQDRLRLDRLQAEIITQHERLKQEQQHHQEVEADWKARQLQAEQETVRLQQEAEKYQQLQAGREAMELALAEKEAGFTQRAQELDQRDEWLHKRSVRLVKLKHWLRQRRQTLADRLQRALETESVTEELQEQLRHRTLALGQEETRLKELNTSYQAQSAELQNKEQEFGAQQAAWRNTLEKEREQLEARRIVLDDQAIQAQKERQHLTSQQATLVQQCQDLEGEIQRLLQQRHEIKEQSETLLSAKTKLLESLPTLLRSAETALEQLATAREQLRLQLQDIQSYRQHCQAKLEAGRSEANQILKQLDERSQMLSQLQDEQRLEAAVLRQDCLTWQARLETLEVQWRAHRRELTENAQRNADRSKELDLGHGRLEVQAVALEEQAQDVAYRRSEVNRHLADMQGWYRHKLRDLADRKLVSQPAVTNSLISAPSAPAAKHEDELSELPSILPLTSSGNDDDQHLADLLSGMGLIDALTLQTLLDQARQQRISLRDCLLANEFLTSYQLELIEAGKLEALVLNSLRVIDRVRIGSMETIYRVFDPRLGDEALLRHLSSSVDQEWQEEYRSLFRQAATIQHPNVARTLDVLEMSGTPAVVQEWLIGLPGTEWTSQVTDPFVTLRLIGQAAAGLNAIHEAGLVHGQLQLGRLLLTAQGELKLCGAGEPRWLMGPATMADRSFHDDVAQLTALVTPWCRGKPASAKRVQETAESKLMTDFVEQLQENQFTTAAALKEAVDASLGSIKSDEGAWQRFLQFIQDRLTIPESMMPQKKSA